jgi:outer membrane receptor protein involved in Fe transport
MTRSRKRKLRRLHAAWAGVPMATSILAAAPPALAQQQADTGVLEEVVVTAQKREESLQNVPLSITAITTEKLEELHITNFDDYAQLIPSVSFQSFGPGFEKVYMRGVVNGGDGNHSGSLPSVGMYLDEQPITTIQGNLDIHLYDIARVEALAGPQGTLYGASSQAGTVRIITNKPDPSGFKASYNLQGTSVSGGDQGYTGEGFVNLPIGERAAVRIVGWVEHDPGYIDNVPGTIAFPTSGICISNTDPPAPGCQASPAHAKKNYNEVDTYGARAALKIDLNDSWTITPSVMGQKQKAKGNFAFNTASGDLKLSHFYPEGSDDRWGQAALTVEGKIGNFDLVYGGAFLKRSVDTTTDYTDYSFFYDACCGYGTYWYDSSGELINPSQHINGKDRYQKWSHELRVASPKDNRFRFVAGAFVQRQQHGIEQRYLIDGLDPFISITGWPDTWWLTEQLRVDRDEAAFAEANFDFTENATLTAGLRHFKYDNSLEGFFGFGANNSFWSCTGEAQGSTTFPPAGLTCAEKFPTLAACDYSVHLNGGPCLNLRKDVTDSGNTPKVSFSYKPSDNKMLYVTYSKGFRPGGVNRRGTLPPYKADFLKNYEFGWKTTIKDGRMRFNGAVFIEDWNNFQFSFLGENSLTQIANAANARIKGLEVDIDYAATSRLTLAGGVAFLEAQLTENYCNALDANNDPITDCANPEAPSGTQLPVTPKFKANLVGRYKFNLGSFDAHVQGSFAYVGSRTSDLRLLQREILGPLGGYLLADFTFGVENDKYAVELYVNNALDRRGVLDKYAQCDASVCGLANSYVNVTMPRTLGIQFSQKF